MPYGDAIQRIIERARKQRKRSLELLINSGQLKAACRETRLKAAKTIARIDEQMLENSKLKDMLAQVDQDD